MGLLIHGGVEVEFDDRMLAHLQIVIVTRFRRGESLVVSWLESPSVGSGRSAIWMTPNQPVFFRFAGTRVPTIDVEWIKVLTASADSSTGLIVTDHEGKLIKAGAFRRHHG